MSNTLTVQTEIYVSDIAMELARDPEAAFDLVLRLSEYIGDSEWEDRIIEMFKEDR